MAIFPHLGGHLGKELVSEGGVEEGNQRLQPKFSSPQRLLKSKRVKLLTQFAEIEAVWHSLVRVQVPRVLHCLLMVVP